MDEYLQSTLTSIESYNVTPKKLKALCLDQGKIYQKLLLNDQIKLQKQIRIEDNKRSLVKNTLKSYYEHEDNQRIRMLILGKNKVSYERLKVIYLRIHRKRKGIQ